MFFYYQRNFRHQWVPATSPESPSGKSMDGTKREIAGVRELFGVEQTFDLACLSELYPPPEDPPPAWVDFDTGPKTPPVVQEVVAVIREYQAHQVPEGAAGRNNHVV